MAVNHDDENFKAHYFLGLTLARLKGRTRDALRHMERTGEGQQVDIGMLDTSVAWLANQGMNYLATGQNPPRLGNQHPNIAPYQVFETKDGAVMITVGNDSTFQRFCAAFGATELATDTRFASNAARVGNREALTAALTPLFKQHPTSWWVKELEANKIGYGPINRLSEVFSDPHVLARGNIIEMTHASGVPMKLVANPVRLSRTPPSYRIAPPDLGQHTQDVLQDWLALSHDEMQALKSKGII